METSSTGNATVNDKTATGIKITYQHLMSVADKLGNALAILTLADHDLDQDLIDATAILHRQVLRDAERMR